MSDAAKGAQRVRAVERHFHRCGFRTAIISRSGQRRGERAGSLAFDGDLLACAPAESPHPHFVVEVGGPGKRVAASLAEMTAQPLPPDFVPLVVCLIDSRRRRWRWHAQDTTQESLNDLLDALTVKALG